MINVIKSVTVQVSQTAGLFLRNFFQDESQKRLKSLVFGKVELLDTNQVVSFNNET